jgi:hypothetical protein
LLVEEEDLLKHQLDYLKQKLLPSSNGEDSNNMDERGYILFSIMLLIVGAAGFVISIEHLRSMNGKAGGRFKSDAYNV